jgi:hypothetical protein
MEGPGILGKSPSSGPMEGSSDGSCKSVALMATRHKTRGGPDVPAT